MAESNPGVPRQEDQSGAYVFQTAKVNGEPRFRVVTEPDEAKMEKKVELSDYGTTAKITWEKKISGEENEKYILSWWTDEKDIRSVETDENKYTLTKLKTGEKYFASVRVKIVDTVSKPSEAIDFYTAPKPPTSIKVENYESSPNDSLIVCFENANKRPMAHRVTVHPIGGEPHKEDVPSGKKFVLIENLKPGHDHYIEVTAVDGETESEPAMYRSKVQMCQDAPIITDLELVEGNRLELTWEKSDIKPLFYRVYYKLNSERSSSAETNETSFIVDNLKPSTTYKFSVTAVNKAGESERSREMRFKTAPARVSKLCVKSNPDAPKRSFLVSYEYPKQEGIKFRVVAESMDGKEAAIVETSETHVALNDLVPGRSYHIYVVTICGDKKSGKLYFL